MLLLPKIVTKRRKRNRNVQCIFTDFPLFTNKPNENNELQPITAVSIDQVLPRVDLEIEHVLIGAGFRPRISSA